MDVRASHRAGIWQILIWYSFSVPQPPFVNFSLVGVHASHCPMWGRCSSGCVMLSSFKMLQQLVHCAFLCFRKVCKSIIMCFSFLTECISVVRKLRHYPNTQWWRDIWMTNGTDQVDCLEKRGTTEVDLRKNIVESSWKTVVC